MLLMWMDGKLLDLRLNERIIISTYQTYNVKEAAMLESALPAARLLTEA